jgi:membrane-associated phospholipid phosphatase
VPTYTIASALAIALMVSTHRLLTPWLLIAVVVVEIALQFLLADHLFENVTIDVVEPMVPLGGAGSNPSGATARLFTLFMVAAAICRPDHQRVARRLVVAGAVITLVEVISRLYLGRHLVLDIFGGLFLGLILTLSTAAMVDALAPLERRLGGRVTW